MSIEGKLPPQALEVETIVLGACMLDADGCKIAVSMISEEVFYNDNNGLIFRAIKTIHDHKDPVDIVTVTQELKRIKELANVGGAYIITQLTNRVSGAANIETHCRILLQLYFKRQLIKIGVETIERGYDDFHDVFDSIDYLKKNIKDMESYIVSDKINDNNEIIDNVLQNIEEAANKGGVTGYSTGLKSLDIGIMGIREQFKYVFAALSGEGKTSLAKTVATSLAHVQGIPGVFFSLEVPKEMLMLSFISDILTIPNQLIQTGQVSQVDKNRIAALKNTLFTNSLIIDDRAGIGPEEMWVTLRKLKQSHGIKWFMIDFLGLQRLKGMQHKGKNEEAILSFISAENKTMAKELDLACVEIVQLTKDTSKRSDFKPRVSDIKGSSAIEQNADVVILIYRPEKHDINEYRGLDTAGLAEFIIAKNRFGPMKNLLATYEGQYTKFSDHSVGNEFIPVPQGKQIDDSHEF